MAARVTQTELQPVMIDPRYVQARRVLLDALEALAPYRDAVILAGAQAVYVRTGLTDVGIAPFTTDGDLALDPSLLGAVPPLERRCAAPASSCAR